MPVPCFGRALLVAIAVGGFVTAAGAVKCWTCLDCKSPFVSTNLEPTECASGVCQILNLTGGHVRICGPSIAPEGCTIKEDVFTCSCRTPLCNAQDNIDKYGISKGTVSCYKCDDCPAEIDRNQKTVLCSSGKCSFREKDGVIGRGCSNKDNGCRRERGGTNYCTCSGERCNLPGDLVTYGYKTGNGAGRDTKGSTVGNSAWWALMVVPPVLAVAFGLARFHPQLCGLFQRTQKAD